MKNIFKYSALLACLAIIGLVSCTQEELSTDQYDDGIVALAAFGPNPVVRGDTLTILGSNLEKVKEVQLPGVDPITEFAEVVPGAKGHIKVLVPVEGPEDAPVSGLVSIVDENGTVFSSTTELSYTEGIKIASFSPAEALPGDIVTIRGEYLYNVREVVFVSGNAKGKTYVTGDAITASRYELKVAVPADAISGLIMLADVDEIADPDALPNTTYTATEITIKDPEVTAFAQKTFKAGDKVDITGAYLNMMQTVKFAGADVDVADFTVSADGKKLTVTLPAAANDGAVTAVSYAGKEFPAGEIVTVRPTELAVAAESRFKAGLNVFVSGKDLDLVTGVKVSGIDATFTTTAAKTTVVLPAESADGDVVLSLANGNTVTAGTVEVVKPVIESLSVTSVVAGETLVVKGTDLDLVTEVAISGQMCEFELEGNDLKVYVSKAAYTGDLVVTAANKVQSASPIEVTYKESVNIEYVKASISLGGTLQLTGTNLMQIESITIKGVKVGEYLSRTDTELSFVLPEDIKSPGIYNLDLVLISGETLTWAVPFEVTAPFTESFIWEGSENLGSWSNQPYFGAEDAFIQLGIEAGNMIKVYFTVNDPSAYWQFQVIDGHWGNLVLPELGNTHTVSKDNWDASLGYFAFNVTADIIGQLTSIQNWGGAFLCQGENVTITGISLIQYGATETVLWEGEAIADDWGNQPYLLSDAGLELAEAGATAGQTVYFYLEQIGSDPWKVQVVEGHWGPTYLSVCAFGADTENGKFTEYDLDANGGKIGITLTQEMLDAALTQQWWGGSFLLNGDNTKCTKVTLQ